MRRSSAWALGAVIVVQTGLARAGDTLVVLDTIVDPPTLIHLGVQVRISDDDDRDAAISVRHREVGAADWRIGPPLHRVRPELVTGLAVPAQFAGTVFGLRPDTDYEVELHAQDPDGLDEAWTVMARTRPVPADPQNPTEVAVSDVAGLKAALAAAAPGHVITLADGFYAGEFSIDKSGTAADPIVLRGASTDSVVLDGGGCPDCNVLEVYASHVHIERMTLQSANRALRFQTAGAEGNVVRRVYVRDVRLGIGAREDQKNFYICDNALEGRLKWPQVYGDDGGMFANEDGVVVMGDGHVVCHNRLVGFGDAIKSEQPGARAVDFYGNLTLSAYDNALELDETAGNSRAVGNMFLNSWSPLSFQPIFGGPAYALRNVVVNVADEQHKLHSNLNSGETVGAQIFHNTFISPGHAINLQAAATAHDFHLQGNLYVGPAVPEAGKVVDWSAPVDLATIDGNGYFPDGLFDFGGAAKWDGFAAMQAAGIYEAHGVLLTAGTFESGLAAPASYTEEVIEPDATLAAGSPAVDAAQPLPGINDDFFGAGPDLGALERGCPAPLFGVRPEGVDESTPVPACDGGEDTGGTSDATGDPETGDTPDVTGDPDTTGAPGTASDDDGATPTEGAASTTGAGTGSAATDASTDASTDAATGGQDGDSGCGCRDTAPRPTPLLALLLLLRRRQRA